MSEDEEPDDDGGRDSETDTEQAGVSTDSARLIGLPVVTSDIALTFGEALRICGRRGARLVMFMGEVHVGKTTVITELWSNLVAYGPIGAYRLAGSRTPIAFEERAFLSRTGNGVVTAQTRRTSREDSGLLHLRVAGADDRRMELLFADYAGEFFEEIREGAPLTDVLPWAGRTDRAVIVIDGAGLATDGKREVAWNHARRQLLALTDASVLAQSARVALVVAKRDAIAGDVVPLIETRLSALLAEARSLDPEAVVIEVAARPGDGSAPFGLEELLAWICMDDRQTVTAGVPDPVKRRAAARFGSIR